MWRNENENGNGRLPTILLFFQYTMLHLVFSKYISEKSCSQIEIKNWKENFRSQVYLK